MIHVATLDPRLEDVIQKAIEHTERGSFLTLSPNALKAIMETITPHIEMLLQAGHTAAVLCSPPIRMQVKKIVDQIQPGIVVISYNEIVPTVRVESIGTVMLPETLGGREGATVAGSGVGQ